MIFQDKGNDPLMNSTQGKRALGLIQWDRPHNHARRTLLPVIQGSGGTASTGGIGIHCDLHPQK